MFWVYILKILFILFLDRGEGREKEGEQHQPVVASRAPPTGDLAWTPGMYPDWESNCQPFGLWGDSQSTKPYQSEFFKLLLEGEEGGERNISVRRSIIWLFPALTLTRVWESDPQPRSGPWLGNEPATCWLWGEDPTNWATPARTSCI